MCLLQSLKTFNKDKMDELDESENLPGQLRVLGSGSVSEESRRLLAVSRTVMAEGGSSCDSTPVLFDLQKKCQEEKELKTRIKEGSQKLKSLQQRTGELQVRIKKQRKEHLSYLFLKEQDADEDAEKAEKKRKEMLFLDAKLESLKLEHAKVMKRKQEQQRQIQRHSAHRDLLEQMVKMTEFDDVKEVTGHIQNLLDVQDHFDKREDKAHEQIIEVKKSLLTLENDHLFHQLQDNNQLAQLQTEIEWTRCETLLLEEKWNGIQEKTAKKTLLMGKITLATNNLYEMANAVEGDEPMNKNDTEEQLDKVKRFIQIYSPIVKQHPTASQKPDGQEKDKTKSKKSITIRTSQDDSI